jgi:hypothetical protein
MYPWKVCKKVVEERYSTTNSRTEWPIDGRTRFSRRVAGHLENPAIDDLA